MGKYPTRPHFAHSNMCPNMTNSDQIRYFGTSFGQPHMVKRGIPEKILPMQFRSIDFVSIVKSYDQISILPDFSIVIGHHHFSPNIFGNTGSKHQTKLHFCLKKVISFIVWLQAKPNILNAWIWSYLNVLWNIWSEDRKKRRIWFVFLITGCGEKW